MLTTPYIGEIRMWPGDFAPQGWLICDGSILQTWQADDLFNLIGNSFGGDGMSTFGLPDFRSRVPACYGKGTGIPEIKMGQPAGRETVTLSYLNMPAHSHTLNAQTAEGTVSAPKLNAIADTGKDDKDFAAGTVATDAIMGVNTTSVTGGGQPYDINQPVLPINFIICMKGVFPSPQAV